MEVNLESAFCFKGYWSGNETIKWDEIRVWEPKTLFLKDDSSV